MREKPFSGLMVFQCFSSLHVLRIASQHQEMSTRGQQICNHPGSCLSINLIPQMRKGQQWNFYKMFFLDEEIEYVFFLI